MFDRLSEPARLVVVAAQREARSLKHDYIGSEHLLLGVLAVSGSVGERVLASFGVSLKIARDGAVRMVGRGERVTGGAIPFTPRAKKLLAVAADLAVSLGQGYVGTGHLLIAIVREDEAVAARILQSLSVDLASVGQAAEHTLQAAKALRPAEEFATPDALPNEGAGGQVTFRWLDPQCFSSATELAHAFGSAVVIPTWWPADTRAPKYSLTPSRGGDHYDVLATRRRDEYVGVVGHLEAGLAGRSPRDWLIGEWSEPPALEHVRGLLGRVGNPQRLQAVIYQHELQIQLLGYDTEQEILDTVDSLRRVGRG